MPYETRRPFRSATPRPAISRPARPPATTKIAPLEPESPGHRRELLKATYHRLAKLTGVPCAELKLADGDRLLSIVAGVGVPDGKQGDARRLVAKVLRLRT
jgi:hypothetical protein